MGHPLSRVVKGSRFRFWGDNLSLGVQDKMPGIGEIPGIGGVGFVVVEKGAPFREREFESQVVKAGPVREARLFFADRDPASLTRYSRYVNEIFNSGRMLCEVRVF